MTFPLGSLRRRAERAYARSAARAAPSARAAGAPSSRWSAAPCCGCCAAGAADARPQRRRASPPRAPATPLHNKAGQLGAWLSDLLLFLFGYSAWWLPLVGARWWLSALARWLRGDRTPAHDAAAWPRAVSVSGLVLLLAASCALEWTRLYRFEALLPAARPAACWAHVLGPLSMKWLGFAGSGVAWIAALVLGASLALRFSWIALADRIGAAFDALRERRAGGASSAPRTCASASRRSSSATTCWPTSSW